MNETPRLGVIRSGVRPPVPVPRLLLTVAGR
jgi:hypothetical protein